MTGAGPDVPAERLFQQRLAQVAPPLVAPAPTVTTPVAPGGQLMPLPVSPMTPQITAPRTDYGLTPYKPKPIPTYTPKPASQSGAVQGAGRSSVTGALQPATAPTPTNIAALNQGLSQISKTLRLQLLSPAAQLTINRAADQNVSLSTEYALGLKTPADGNHLALVGSLKDLIGLFSQANNAQFFAPMLNSDASVTLKGLQQRHTKALHAEALNRTRAQLKQMETARAPGHLSFNQLYPNLSLSTVTDRSNAWQNGIGANRQADRLGAGLNQHYVLGYQLPVKLNNNTTVQVPVNLTGPLKDLAQFFLRGGDSWLQASSLIGNKSTGLTPEGVIQRYGAAKTNAGDTYNPNQRSENQTGGTTGQQLSGDVDLSRVTNEETTIPTELPNDTKRSPFISVKPSDPSDTEKTDGVIAPQLSQNMQPVNPGPEGSDAKEPIKASGAENNKMSTPNPDNILNNDDNEHNELRQIQLTEQGIKLLEGVNTGDYDALLEVLENTQTPDEFEAFLAVAPADFMFDLENAEEIVFHAVERLGYQKYFVSSDDLNIKQALQTNSLPTRRFDSYLESPSYYDNTINVELLVTDGEYSNIPEDHITGTLFLIRPEYARENSTPYANLPEYGADLNQQNIKYIRPDGTDTVHIFTKSVPLDQVAGYVTNHNHLRNTLNFRGFIPTPRHTEDGLSVTPPLQTSGAIRISSPAISSHDLNLTPPPIALATQPRQGSIQEALDYFAAQHGIKELSLPHTFRNYIHTFFYINPQQTPDIAPQKIIEINELIRAFLKFNQNYFFKPNSNLENGVKTFFRAHGKSLENLMTQNGETLSKLGIQTPAQLAQYAIYLIHKTENIMKTLHNNFSPESSIQLDSLIENAGNTADLQRPDEESLYSKTVAFINKLYLKTDFARSPLAKPDYTNPQQWFWMDQTPFTTNNNLQTDQEKIPLVTTDDIAALDLSIESNANEVNTKINGLMKEKYLANGGSTEKIDAQLVQTLWGDVQEQLQNSGLFNAYLQSGKLEHFLRVYQSFMSKLDPYAKELSTQIDRIKAKIPEWKAAVDNGEDIVVVLDIDDTVLLVDITPMDIFDKALYRSKVFDSKIGTERPIPEMQGIIQEFEENGIPYRYITARTEPPSDQPNRDIDQLREHGLFGDHAHPSIDYSPGQDKRNIRLNIIMQEGKKIVGSIGDSYRDLTGDEEIDFKIPRLKY